jgi:hypothetical protein
MTIFCGVEIGKLLIDIGIEFATIENVCIEQGDAEG